jgi:hypothetical protein
LAFSDVNRLLSPCRNWKTRSLPFLIMRLAKTPVLQTCVYRINGLSPAGDDLPALAEMVTTSMHRLRNAEFREWLSFSESRKCSSPCVSPAACCGR